jgi:hypothetical protein
VNAKRLLAIVAAAAMIAGAWFVRTKVIDKNTTVATAGDTTQPTDVPADGLRRLRCISELELVCQGSGLGYLVEPAGTTLAFLATTPNPDIIWMTMSPWPEMADSTRARNGLPPLPATERKVLGSTTVVLAAPTERIDILKKACADLSWTCIGEKANQPWEKIGGQVGWRDVTFQHRDPLTSASGLSVFGAALAGRTARTDLATSDLADNAVRSWANQLENSNKRPGTNPLDSVVLGTRFDVVGALAVELPLGAKVTTLEPTPVAQVGATVMASMGKLSTDSATKLSAALGKNGWSPAVTPSGLPDAVGMEAVQQLWKQVISS